jgi:hypothetical protein
MKAGELFTCVCCRESRPDEEAVLDREQRGPVCLDCRKLLRNAEAWLRHHGLVAPTQDYNKRIK